MATAALTAGQVLAQRYLVKRLIGLGSLAATYEAEDTTLQRSVALRIYDREVVVSDEWREYFRHQVTAVAALHHPSLVRIYEWGETAEFVYLVTEYLVSGSLRDVLRERGQLTREQTAMIGLEAASALAYAHARGMVHGAIRPSKILFDRDGRVRVSDLGVASALASAPRPSDSLEEARYVSPEQVLGEPVDGRSDVYSLCLVLFQCLTGEIAHDAATASAARSARIGAPLPHRAELGPLDLALALGAAPDVSARPDAALLANRLEAVASTLPVPRPVTLSAENLAGFKVPSSDEILTSPAVAAAIRPLDEETGEVEAVVRPFDLPGYKESVASVTTRIPTRRRRSGAAGAVLFSIIVLIVALGIASAWQLGAFKASYRVPNLVGLNYQDVALTPGASHFTINVAASVTSKIVPADKIVSQNPQPGTSASAGSTIRIVISKGTDLVTLPSVVGLSCANATAELSNVQVSASCPTSAQVASTTVQRGGVVDLWFGSIKNPTQVPAGATVILALSSGTTGTSSTTTTTINPTAPRAVPRLVGLDPSQVDAAMKQAQLYYSTNWTGPPGTWHTVVSTNPVAGTIVPWHSNVALSVR